MKEENSKGQIATLILKGGAVYTVDRKRSWAEAVAIRNGSIIYVGGDNGLAPYIGPSTRIIDLEGKMVLPGFFDAHCHASLGAVALAKTAQLVGLNSIEAYGKTISKFAADNPDLPVIQGNGWSNTVFGEKGPQKEFLDRLIPDRPIALASEDGHSLWVNSKALEIAEITKNTPDPQGGAIEKNSETGEPTGLLKESAMGLVYSKIPDYSVEDYMEGLTLFQKTANTVGLTTVHDPLLYHDLGNMQYPSSDNGAQAIEKLRRENRLTLRYRGSWINIPERSAAEQIAAFIEARKKYTDDLFQVNAVKFFADGVIEAGTAYLLEPYTNNPDSCGEEFSLDHKAFREAVAAFDKAGFQVHVHAIGDAAIRITLDAFEYAQRVNGKRDSRHSITHLQLVAPEDVKRMAELGVIGLPQPYWFMKDDYYWTIELPYLGKERADKEYPMKSLMSAGVVMAAASDFPVPSTDPSTHEETPFMHPLAGIYTGIVRSAPGATTDPGKTLKEGESGVLWAEERVSLDDMITSFTINGAYANFLEKETGSIEVGKKADLVVLDNNLFKIPVEGILETKIAMTFLEGKVVYQQ